MKLTLKNLKCGKDASLEELSIEYNIEEFAIASNSFLEFYKGVKSLLEGERIGELIEIFKEHLKWREGEEGKESLHRRILEEREQLVEEVEEGEEEEVQEE